MASDQLTAALRAAPDDRSAALVYADELLGLGDPLGERIQAQQGGALDAWLTQHGPPLLEKLAKPEWIRLCGGFVRQVTWDQDALLTLPRLTLEHEPLATVVTPSFDKNATRDHLLRLRNLLEHSNVFGLELTCDSDSPALDLSNKQLRELPVVALRVNAQLLPWLTQLRAPSLSVLCVPSLTPAMHERPWTKTVRWLSLRSLTELGGVLQWPALETIDLRGLALTANHRKLLDEWSKTPGRTVLHEHSTLEDRSSFAHVFSAAGHWYPERRPNGRHIAIARDGEFVSTTQRTVRGYRDADPTWQAALPSPAKSVRADEDGYEIICETNERLCIDPSGAPIRRDPLPVPSRVTARSGTLVGTVSDDSVTVTNTTGDPIASWKLGGGLRVIVSAPGGFCVASNHHVWHLVPGSPPRLLLEERSGVQALLASGGDWVAVSLSPGHVAQLKTDGTRVDCHWPGSFSRDDGGPLEVVGLCVEPGGRALVALPDGALNLLDADGGQAFKPGEFDDQPYRHWVFVYDGNILVSD